jgi:hypothetical protein
MDDVTPPIGLAVVDRDFLAGRQDVDNIAGDGAERTLAEDRASAAWALAVTRAVPTSSAPRQASFDAVISCPPKAPHGAKNEDNAL